MTYPKASSKLITLATLSLLISVQASGEEALRLDQLILKATHNSYASTDCDDFFEEGNTCPVMHNRLLEQIDDWGVWVVELDYSFMPPFIGLDPIPYIGHNWWEGCDTWTEESWRGSLWLILQEIKYSRSFQYRPVVIKLEYKDWGIDLYDDPMVSGPAIESLLIQVFGIDSVFGPDDLGNGPWPSVAQLAGKVIVWIISVNIPNYHYSSGKIFDSSPFPDWGPNDSYTDLNSVLNAIQNDKKIIFTDQYQVSWTFDYAASPNPLVVKSNGLPFSIVSNEYGKPCPSNDPTNPGQSFFVGQEGTFRFPFKTVNSAVTKALSGWTILIASGSYPETMTINKRVTLKADGGTVTIGR